MYVFSEAVLKDHKHRYLYTQSSVSINSHTPLRYQNPDTLQFQTTALFPGTENGFCANIL